MQIPVAPGLTVGGFLAICKLLSVTWGLGAPECYLPDITANVKRSIDVWSLGCVFSEAATWAVFGTAELNRYRQQRKQEVLDKPSFRDEDCFHDGEKVLKTVRTMHDRLRTGARRFDCLTKDLVELMLHEMLETSESRPTATQLLTKSERILKEAEEQLGSYAMDHTYSERPQASGFSNSQPRPQPPPESPTPIPTFHDQQIRSLPGQTRRWTASNDSGEPRPTNTHSIARQRVPSPENIPEDGNGNDHQWPKASSRSPTSPRRSYRSARTSQHESSYHQSDPGNRLSDPIDADFDDSRPSSGPVGRSGSARVAARGKRRGTSGQSHPFSHEEPDNGISIDDRRKTGGNNRLSFPESESDYNARYGDSPSHSPPSNKIPPNPHVRSGTKGKNGHVLPSMTVSEGLQWKKDKKGRVPNTRLPHGEYMQELNQRDHVGAPAYHCDNCVLILSVGIHYR
jgi:hypothetical protein